MRQMPTLDEAIAIIANTENGDEYGRLPFTRENIDAVGVVMRSLETVFASVIADIQDATSHQQKGE